MTKRKPRINTVLSTDESGNKCIFTVPFEGLFYLSKMTTATDELRVESRFQKIITDAEDYDHIEAPLLFDDEDRMDFVKLYKKLRCVKGTTKS